MKSLVIDEKVHKKLKKYCEKKGLKINSLVSSVIEEFLRKEILRDEMKGVWSGYNY